MNTVTQVAPVKQDPIQEFISDVKRICEEIRSHMRSLPYDPILSKHSSYLEGLVKRAADLEVRG